MINKNSFLIMGVFLISVARASEINIKTGWNLVGSTSDIENIASVINDAEIIWKYEGGSWSAASSNSDILSLIVQNGIPSFSKINAGEGFWVSSQKEESININDTFSDSKISLKKGWNLVSLKSLNDINVSEYFNASEIEIVWKYENNGWLAYSPDESMQKTIDENYQSFDSVKVNEGFWVLANDDCEIDLAQIQDTAQSGDENDTQNDENSEINYPPVINSPGEISVNEGSVEVMKIDAQDANGDILTYSISGNDAGYFNINTATGEITFKTASDYESKPSYQITVAVSDGVNEVTKDVSINVINLNDNIPVLNVPETISVNENQKDIITLNATDPDADILTYSIGGEDASYFNIDPQTGVITAKENLDYETKKEYVLTVGVNDGIHSVEKNVTINVTNQNDNAPVFTSPQSITVNENQTEALTLSATDEDGDNLTYSLSGDDAAYFNIDSASGKITFKTPPDYESKSIYNITAGVSDGVHKTEQNIIINVNNVNDNAPVINTPESLSVNADETDVVKIDANDADGDTLTYCIEGEDAGYFNVDAKSGEVSFVDIPSSNDKEIYHITLCASDSAYSVKKDVTVEVLQEGSAYLGNLADANVSIYEINGESNVTLLWSEKTSVSDELENIGKFNTHAFMLDDDKYYLFVIEGGLDYDSDDDGYKDENFTVNYGKIRAIVKGSDIKSADGFTVSFLSEYVFKYMKNYVNEEDFETIEAALVKELFDTDVNDTKELIKKVYEFVPFENMQELGENFKSFVPDWIDAIHNNKLPQLEKLITLNDVNFTDTDAGDDGVFEIELNITAKLPVPDVHISVGLEENESKTFGSIIIPEVKRGTAVYKVIVDLSSYYDEDDNETFDMTGVKEFFVKINGVETTFFGEVNLLSEAFAKFEEVAFEYDPDLNETPETYQYIDDNGTLQSAQDEVLSNMFKLPVDDGNVTFRPTVKIRNYYVDLNISNVKIQAKLNVYNQEFILAAIGFGTSVELEKNSLESFALEFDLDGENVKAINSLGLNYILNVINSTVDLSIPDTDPQPTLRQVINQKLDEISALEDYNSVTDASIEFELVDENGTVLDTYTLPVILELGNRAMEAFMDNLPALVDGNTTVDGVLNNL